MSNRAAVYVRISQDRTGAGLGVARQEEDCRSLAGRKGWDVDEVFVDNDVSAYSGAPRPAWQRLVRAVQAGAFDALVCWHVDRLTRSVRELEDVIDLAAQHRLDLATVTGEVDLGTPTGRMVARMMGVAARHESEHKAERQVREREASAKAGKVAGGGMRPYGYQDDRVTVVEAEAEVIRGVARRVLSGESLSSVCRDLAASGITTPTGGTWKPTTLRRLLASARISGRREHTPVATLPKGRTRPLCGQIVADAVWPGVVDADTSDRLRALLCSPGRRSHDGTGRTYLLSGLLRCGKCGTGMVGRPRSGVPRYVCPNTPGGTSCGGMATGAARTDEHIVGMVLTALASPALAEHLIDDGSERSRDAAALAGAERDMEVLAEMLGAGEMTRDEWRAARRPLAERVEALRTALLVDRRTALLTGVDLTGADLQTAWDGMTVAQRRELVASVVERIEVASADPRRKWDPDRFALAWRA